MDYSTNNASLVDDSAVILALVRRRALDTENYLGPLLVNPGVSILDLESDFLSSAHTTHSQRALVDSQGLAMCYTSIGVGRCTRAWG